MVWYLIIAYPFRQGVILARAIFEALKAKIASEPLQIALLLFHIYHGSIK